ncbi:hypothetical protein N665_0050s0051 [Sinapis alba]|nr:hypothetical protein N665_0050s0051 [Sinapis alba]
MALSTSQLVAFLIACSLLFTSQSKIVRIEEKGQPMNCDFRSKCNSDKDCTYCGPPFYPKGTVGLCMHNRVPNAHYCCCSLI